MFAIHLVLAVAIGADQPSSAAALRLAVVDDSGSMSGDKITLVRQELTRIVRAQPPSATRPFALIVFGASAKPARVFTDLASAETAIAALSGDAGGTNIAAALEQAAADLKRLSASNHAQVLLFTDGQDSNRGAIREAEDALDKLFTSRKQQGLSQRVYLKQWGAGGLDSLAKRLRATGSADVIDVDKLVDLPVTLIPKITIESVRRLDDQRILAIEWKATPRLT